ncbi:MAG: hypothetical protein ACK5CL_08845, partial [Sphingomonadales bacterium]
WANKLPCRTYGAPFPLHPFSMEMALLRSWRIGVGKGRKQNDCLFSKRKITSAGRLTQFICVLY